MEMWTRIKVVLSGGKHVKENVSTGGEKWNGDEQGMFN
jgi:hypothetical protein